MSNYRKTFGGFKDYYFPAGPPDAEGDLDETSIAILPSQWADRQQANDSGHHRLLRALFEGALYDLARYYGKRKHHPNYYRLLYEHAREWIAGDGGSFPFYLVMDHLGYDVEKTRASILVQYPELPAPTKKLSREERDS